MANTYPFILNPSNTPPDSVNNKSLDFGANSVIINNPTGQWWNVGIIGPVAGQPQIPVGPYINGMVIQLPLPNRNVNIAPITPTGLSSQVIPGQTASFIYTDAILPASPGNPISPPTQVPLISTTVAANGTLNYNSDALANGTNIFLIVTNQSYNNYSVFITDRDSTQEIINFTTRPQPQFNSVPLIPTSQQRYSVQITNNSPNATLFQIWAVVGTYPIQVQPLEGFVRTSVEVAQVGYADFDQAVPTGDSGTYRWNVLNPSNSAYMIYVDHAFVELAQANTSLYGAVTIRSQSGVEQSVVTQVGNQIASQPIPGPVLVAPGYQLSGFTQNQSGATQNMIVSATYHYVPL